MKGYGGKVFMTDKELYELAKKEFTFDALINTVPEKVLSHNEMKNLNQECLFIEIASSPFGIKNENILIYFVPRILAILIVWSSFCICGSKSSVISILPKGDPNAETPMPASANRRATSLASSSVHLPAFRSRSRYGQR